VPPTLLNLSVGLFEFVVDTAVLNSLTVIKQSQIHHGVKMIEAIQQTILELLSGNVLLYLIIGGIFALVVGAVTIDRNGSTWIVVALPIAGGLVAPMVAFVVAILTDTVFSFSIPGLFLPLIAVLAVSLLLTYGYSVEEAPAGALP